MSRSLKSYQSEGSIMSTIRSSMTESSKCPACTKSVYHVEEIICSGSTWHKDCFKCGGVGDLGCQRKLNLSDFTLHSAVPYCKGCFTKVTSKPLAAAEEIVIGASSGSDRTDLNDLNGFVKISQRRSSFGAPGRTSVVSNALGAVKLACPKCTKTVYKAEEIKLAGFSWHKSCFTCGGASETDGCKRTLNAQDVRPHRGIPFCKGCIGKQPILQDKKADTSLISRSDTDSSETSAQETSIDANETSILIDESTSATTTLESIMTTTSADTEQFTTPVKSASKIMTTPTATAATVPVAGASPAVVAIASPATSPTIATVVAVDGRPKDGEREENVEIEEGETSYIDGDGVPCTKDGEPLTVLDSVTLNSESGTPSAPAKRENKMKKLFKTVFGIKKKQTEVLSNSTSEVISN